MWARLKQLLINNDEIVLALDSNTFTLGRNSKVCHPGITLNNKKVSAKHCQIVRKSEEVSLTDYSSNGTFINGERVGKDSSKLLQSGDVISLLYPETTPTQDDQIIFKFEILEENQCEGTQIDDDELSDSTSEEIEPLKPKSKSPERVEQQKRSPKKICEDSDEEDSIPKSEITNPHKSQEKNPPTPEKKSSHIPSEDHHESHIKSSDSLPSNPSENSTSPNVQPNSSEIRFDEPQDVPMFDFDPKSNPEPPELHSASAPTESNAKK